MKNEQRKKNAEFYFWKFVHNAVIHPLMSGPWEEPEWLNEIHDWTAKKCWGAG
jgi:hypothetical protein